MNTNSFLTEAAGNKGFKGLIRLLNEATEVKARDLQDGRTALIVASAAGHSDMVSLLLHRGADVNTRDKGGRTALTWASVNGHTRVVNMLKAYGARE